MAIRIGKIAITNVVIMYFKITMTNIIVVIIIVKKTKFIALGFLTIF